jgi:hypothetical protein
MALTEFQRRVCRLLAGHRLASGESYVAGGSALSEFIASPRISRDVDLFHDTEEAVAVTWDADRRLLEIEGLLVRPVRERPAFVEAEVREGEEAVLLQWVRDSAFRFFPLVEHPDMGLVLHPFDLATNKVLALVGRLEVRDWVDVIGCHDRIQRLGYLVWAASAKDPGFSPSSILELATRSSRYSREEISALAFEREPPDAGQLSRAWHSILGEAAQIVAALPPAETGKCVLNRDGTPCNRGPEALPDLLARDALLFHEGRIRGALPQVKSKS